MIALFVRPGWLVCALAAIPALLFFWARFARSRRALESINAAAMASGRRSLMITIAVRSVFLSLAWVSLSVAAAGPRWGTELVAERSEGACVALVMDVSRSMTASDVSPDRLGYAARYATALLSRLNEANVAVVLSKGEAHLAVPATSDRLVVHSLLSSLSPSLLTSPGSNLSSALETALGSFPSNLSGARAIVFFTDGDETSGDIVAAAGTASATGITVAFVGVGTEEGADISIVDASGGTGTHRATLRERRLAAAAKAVGAKGLYVDSKESGSALKLLSAIRSSGGSKGKPSYKTKTVDRTSAFLFASLALFCCSILSGAAYPRKEEAS